MISIQKKNSHKNSCDEHYHTIHVQTFIVSSIIKIQFERLGGDVDETVNVSVNKTLPEKKS